MLMLIFFIGLLLILFIVGVPVAASIGLTCLAVLWAENDLLNIPITLLPLKMMHGVNNFPLMAVPFFILAANMMNKGSVTQASLAPHRLSDPLFHRVLPWSSTVGSVM